jgi:hypothetical protein
MAPLEPTLSSLPDELLTNILERVSRRHWQTVTIRQEGVQGLKCVSKKWRDIVNKQGAFCQQDLLVVICIHDQQFRVALGEFSGCRTRLTFKLQPHRGMIVSDDEHVYQVGFQGKNVLLTHCPNNDCFSMSEHQYLSYDLDQSQGWGAYVGPLVEVCDRWNALWRRHGSGVGPWDHIYFEETRDSRYRLVGFRNLRAGGTVGETLLGPFELPASRYRGDPDVLTVDGDVYVIGEARSQILNRDNGANHIIDTYWEAENGISCAKAPTIFWSCVRTANRYSR